MSKESEEGDGGAPAWVMTFADLMSLLMCFFVLLLSFAEMDLQKFKQISGSMKNAFGVQRDIKVKEMPKGTSVIAREFSPGRPTPTPVQEVRQQTVDETRQTVEFTDATTEKNDDGTGESADNIEQAPVRTEHISDIESQSELDTKLQVLSEIVTEMSQEMAEIKEKHDENLSEEEKADLEKATTSVTTIEEKIEELLKLDKDLLPHVEVAKEPSYEKTRADAQKLMDALEPEIKEGLVSIETESNKILLRIKEKGSFPSGSSTMKGGFMPVIEKLKESLRTIEGQILVAGHTDNVPIKTSRFRSNWELSSSRSVTVVHELLNESKLNPRRFAVEGHGSAHPIVPNNNPENRALNRRVELTIVQSGDDSDSEISLEAEKTNIEETNISEESQTEEVLPEKIDLSEELHTEEILPDKIDLSQELHTEKVLPDKIDLSEELVIEETLADEAQVSEETPVEEDKQAADFAEFGTIRNRLQSISEGLKQD